MAIKKRDAAHTALGAAAGAVAAQQVKGLAKSARQNRSMENPNYSRMVGGRLRKADAMASNSARGIQVRATESAVKQAKGLVGRQIRNRPDLFLTPAVKNSGEKLAKAAPRIAGKAISRSLVPSVLDFVNVQGMSEGRRKKGPKA